MTSRAHEGMWNVGGKLRAAEWGLQERLGQGRCWRLPGEGPGPHLVQHGIALGPLSLPEQHQASDDVRRHNVQVPKKLRKEVGDFRVGVL